EIDDVVDPALGDVLQKLLCRFPVGIYESYALPVLDVLDGHVLEGDGLAHACFADQIHMAPPVVGLDPELLALVAEGRHPEKINVFVFHEFIL
ncbi:MAG: hypothetical protein WC364_13605, partial [Eubacteriales bacterium]